jgi:hypothetical protein
VKFLFFDSCNGRGKNRNAQKYSLLRRCKAMPIWEETPRKNQCAWGSRMRGVMRYFWRGGLFGKIFEIGIWHDAARQNAAPVSVMEGRQTVSLFAHAEERWTQKTVPTLRVYDISCVTRH